MGFFFDGTPFAPILLKANTPMNRPAAPSRNLRHGWVFLLTGILLIIAGAAAFSHPVLTTVAVGLSLGIVIILQGVSHIVFAIGNRHLPHWSWHLLIGFIDLLIGSLLLPYPDITLVVLPFLVGFWFLLRGISLILYAITLRHFIVAGWGWFLAGGIFIAAFAAFIIKFPQLGYGTIVLWTAIALVATGISNIFLAFRLKHRKDDTEQSIII